MRETPESLPYGEYLPDVYRFAFLMTGSGDTAADVLRHTVVRAARGGLNDIRNPLEAKHWLFAEARTLCADPPPTASRGDVPPALAPSTPGPPVDPPPPLPDMGASVIPDDPPRQLALLFAGLPEDERSALILFYLFLFDPAELADLLEIKPAALGPLLLRGRTLLQRHGDLCDNLFAALAPATPGAPSDDPAATPSAKAAASAVPDAA